jgi:hypothetical protein
MRAENPLPLDLGDFAIDAVESHRTSAKGRSAMAAADDHDATGRTSEPLSLVVPGYAAMGFNLKCDGFARPNE